MADYTKEYRPKKYLFEGQDGGNLAIAYIYLSCVY